MDVASRSRNEKLTTRKSKALVGDPIADLEPGFEGQPGDV